MLKGMAVAGTSLERVQAISPAVERPCRVTSQTSPSGPSSRPHRPRTHPRPRQALRRRQATRRLPSRARDRAQLRRARPPGSHSTSSVGETLAKVTRRFNSLSRRRVDS